MKTLILPGYSLKNSEWASDIADRLGGEAEVHEWQHWAKGSFSLPRELSTIHEEIGDEKVNILAKSVGTRVAMSLLIYIPDQIEKLVLCGIPTRGTSASAKENYSPLSKINPEKVLVFQNTKDPLAGYKDIKRFVGSINSEIKVVEMPHSDHSYPYPDEFRKFFGS